MLGEDTGASEHTYSGKVLLGAKTRGHPKTLSENTSLANTLPEVNAHWPQKTPAEDMLGKGTSWSKTPGRAETLAADRSGEDMRHREDTSRCEDTLRRKVW